MSANDDKRKCDSGREGDVTDRMGIRMGFWKIGMWRKGMGGKVVTLPPC